LPGRRGRGSLQPVKISLFLLSGIALCVAGYGSSEVLSQHRQITTFRPVEVTVLSRKVESRTSRGRRGRTTTKYTPVISYLYQADGRAYQGARVMPRLDGQSRAWAYEIVNRFREGQVYQGFYDPRNPGDSFLIPHYSFVPYLLILLPAGAVGLGLFFGLLYSAQKPAPPVPYAGGWFEIALQKSVPRKLRVALWTAVFWHVAGLLVATHYFGAAKPPYETLGVVSTSLYEALGVIPVITAFYYHLLKRNAGDARLTINLERPRSGDEFTARVEQEIHGDLEIESLRVGLICDQTTRGRHGTKTSACHEQWITALEGHRSYPGETLVAGVKLQVPAVAEPSTPPDRKGYPRHSWRIAMHTRMTGSPDYRANFLLVVDPRRPESGS